MFRAYGRDSVPGDHDRIRPPLSFLRQKTRGHVAFFGTHATSSCAPTPARQGRPWCSRPSDSRGSRSSRPPPARHSPLPRPPCILGAVTAIIAATAVRNMMATACSVSAIMDINTTAHDTWGILPLPARQNPGNGPRFPGCSTHLARPGAAEEPTRRASSAGQSTTA